MVYSKLVHIRTSLVRNPRNFSFQLAPKEGKLKTNLKELEQRNEFLERLIRRPDVPAASQGASENVTRSLEPDGPSADCVRASFDALQCHFSLEWPCSTQMHHEVAVALSVPVNRAACSTIMQAFFRTTTERDVAGHWQEIRLYFGHDK